MNLRLASLVVLILIFCARPALSATRLNHLSSGSGEPVVLIHGSYGSLQDYTYSIQGDLALKFRAIAVDLPGHGRSRRTQMTMTLEDHANALHDDLAFLKVKKPVLVGHSWGGAVALAYTLKYPDDVSALVLLGAYTTPFQKLPLKYRLSTTPFFGSFFVRAAVRPFARFGDPLKLVEDSFKPNAPPEDYAKAAVAQSGVPGAFQATAEDIKALGPGLEKIQSRLGEIRCPVIIVTGDSDAVAPPEQHAYPLHRKIPQSELIVLPGTGHQPQFAKPKEVIAAIERAWALADKKK